MILVFRKNTKNPANFRFHPNLQDFFLLFIFNYFLSLITFYLSFAVVIDKLPDNPGLQNGNQRRDEIIITQSRRITVENKQEHDRHDVHHRLHSFHLVILRLVLAIVPHVQDVRDRH